MLNCAVDGVGGAETRLSQQSLAPQPGNLRADTLRAWPATLRYSVARGCGVCPMAASSRRASISPRRRSQDRHRKGRGIRMQATGLRTGQPALNRGFLGALLAVVVAAALVAFVIVGTAGPT